jgi:hypothetical protein
MHKHRQQPISPEQGLLQIADSMLALARHRQDHRLNPFQVGLAR